MKRTRDTVRATKRNSIAAGEDPARGQRTCRERRSVYNVLQEEGRASTSAGGRPRAGGRPGRHKKASWKTTRKGVPGEGCAVVPRGGGNHLNGTEAVVWESDTRRRQGRSAQEASKM